MLLFSFFLKTDTMLGKRRNVCISLKLDVVITGVDIILVYNLHHSFEMQLILTFYGKQCKSSNLIQIIVLNYYFYW